LSRPSVLASTAATLATRQNRCHAANAAAIRIRCPETAITEHACSASCDVKILILLNPDQAARAAASSDCARQTESDSASVHARRTAREAARWYSHNVNAWQSGTHELTSRVRRSSASFARAARKLAAALCANLWLAATRDHAATTNSRNTTCRSGLALTLRRRRYSARVTLASRTHTAALNIVLHLAAIRDHAAMIPSSKESRKRTSKSVTGTDALSHRIHWCRN